MSVLRLPSPIPTHDIITISIHTFVDSLAVILNVLFLLAIALRTPPNLRSYALLLIICALIDIIAATTSCLIMIRLIPAGDLLAYAYDGPCVAVSGFFCHSAYTVMLTCFSQSVRLLPISFGYCLYALGRGSPHQSRRGLIFVCLLSSAHNLAILASFGSTLDEPALVRDRLRALRPEYHLDGGSRKDSHIVEVLKSVMAQSAQMSGKTKQMHRDLTKVLSLQSMIPALFFFAACSYFSCVLELYHSPASEHFIMTSTTFSPLIAPAVPFFYIKPYRK